MEVTIKTRLTGIQTQQARETRAPWTDTSVNDRWQLLLKLEKLDKVICTYGNWDSNAASKGDRNSLD